MKYDSRLGVIVINGFIKFHSMRSKLIVTFLLAIAVPTLIVLNTYFDTSINVVEQEIYTANQSLVEQAAISVNDRAKRMIQVTYLLETELSDLLKSHKFTWDYNNAAEMRSIIEIQKRMVSLRNILLDESDFIGFIDNDYNMVTTLNSFNREGAQYLAEQLFKLGMGEKGYAYWDKCFQIPPTIGYTLEGQHKNFVLLVKSFAYDYSSKNLGGIVVGIPVELFFGGNTEVLPKHMQMFVLGQDGTLSDVYGNPKHKLTPDQIDSVNENKANIKKLNIDHATYLMNVASVPQIGLSLVTLQQMEDFSGQLDKSLTISMFVFLLCFGIGIILFIFILLRLTKPLHTLVRSMSRVGIGVFRAIPDVSGRDEIALLGRQFNKMVQKLDELVRYVAEEQKNKEEAHFQALQAQINPHFLFNTLNSIKLMAMLSNTNHKVSDMITALGRLMEFSMKQSTLFVTMRQELEYLELYMSLQKIRYHENIVITTNVPNELMDCMVLKFTLQPLVENSIIHGEKFPIKISIELERQGPYVLIHIRDNGKAITEEEIQIISNQLHQDSVKTSGIGLLNVERRIKMHFGQDCGLKLSSVEGGGLQVTVCILYREGNEV